MLVCEGACVGVGVGEKVGLGDGAIVTALHAPRTSRATRQSALFSFPLNIIAFSIVFGGAPGFCWMRSKTKRTDNTSGTATIYKKNLETNRSESSKRRKQKSKKKTERNVLEHLKKTLESGKV